MDEFRAFLKEKKMLAKEVIEEFLLLGLYKTNGIKISELNKVTKESLSSHICEKILKGLREGHFLYKKRGEDFS